MIKIILIAIAVLTCAGCQTGSQFCTGTAAGQAAVGSTPLGLLLSVPCAVNDTVLIGGSIASSIGNSSSPSESNFKTFRSSKAVSDELSNSGDLMQFVLDSQDRYKAADYGDATSEQKLQAIGRYVSPKLGKSIVIVDAQKAFQVMFENEYVPQQAKSNN